MRSLDLSCVPHFGHAEGGLTTDCFAGMRIATTLKNEPSTRPMMNM